MKVVVGWAVFFMLAAIPVGAQELQALVLRAIDHNAAMNVSRETLQKAKLEQQAMNALYLPLLAVDGSYRYVSEVAQMTLPAIPPRTLDISTHENIDTGLSVSYLLYSGRAKESQLEIKALQVKSAELQLRKQSREVAFDVSRLYLTLQVLTQQRTLVQTAQQRSQTNLRKIGQLLTQGMALEVDRLGLALLSNRYEQQLRELNSNIQSTAAQLNLLSGETVTLSENLSARIESDPRPFDPDYAEDLQLLDIKQQIVRLSAAISVAKNYPEVVLSGAFRYAKPGINAINNDWMSYYVMGAVLRFNLWDFDSARLGASAQLQDVQIARDQQAFLKDQLSLKYQQLERDYQDYVLQDRIFKQSTELSQKKLQLVQAQFDLGLMSATDLKNAELDYSEAQVAQQQHQGKLRIKLLELDYASARDIETWRYN